jgi:hypothetical protein
VGTLNAEVHQRRLETLRALPSILGLLVECKTYDGRSLEFGHVRMPEYPGGYVYAVWMAELVWWFV